MSDACARFYHGLKKPLPLKKLMPTDINLQLHVLQARFQMLLRKAADQRDPPEAQDIANPGWSIEGSTITPNVSTVQVVLQVLLDVVSCSCTTEGKASSDGRCNCNDISLSCTDYYKCERRVACCSHLTRQQINIEGNKGELDENDE